MSLMSSRWWPRLKAAVITSAVVLAGCGGSTFDAFKPQRILSFGDEYSYIDDSGRRYTVDYVASNGTRNCDEEDYRLWNQAVVEHYDLAFAQCNPLGLDSSRTFLYARPGATVADIGAQIDHHLATAGVQPRDLALILGGNNDIKALAARFPEQDAATLRNAAYDAGKALGEQINRLIDLDVRVLVLTPPDLGLSPYGAAQDALVPGRKALMSEMSTEFIRGLRDTIVNDGRLAALALSGDLVRRIVEDPQDEYSSYIHDRGACQEGVDVLDCTTTTLRDGISTGRLQIYVYADDQHVSPNIQRLWGRLAIERMRENPF